MKWMVIFLTFLATTAHAKDERQLLKCLGEEEKRFHLKKEVGPIYDLNQRLIAEMIQIPKADIRPEDFKKICGSDKISPSLKLLELSIQKGSSLFIVPPQTASMQQEVTQGMIDEYIEATKEIFLSFISQIQTIAPSPNCLKEEIPLLDAFFTDIKYLQEDVDIKRLFKGRDEKIFHELTRYPEAFQRCRVRLRKKPKPVSTAAPKKS